MKKGKDISAQFGGLYLVHQNIPGKVEKSLRLQQHILFIPLQGEIGVEVGEMPFSLGVGQMLFLPEKTLHSFSSSREAGERLIALINPNEILLPPKAVPTILPLHQLIKEILFYLLLHPQTKNAKSLTQVFYETLTEALVDRKQAELANDQLEGRVTDPRVKKAILHLRENLDQNISMDQIAKVSGLSLRSLNRLFTKETGLQPKQWLINFRIEMAKDLLMQPQASVTEVAFSVGYSSLGQFISAFRSRTGRLPSEFLKHGV